MSAPREQAVVNGHETATTAAVTTIQNYIGGRWDASAATRFGEVRNPADDTLLGRVPLGGAADVDRAVQAALKAYPGWRATPAVHRLKPLFKLKSLLEEHFEDVARVCTREHGKTLDESRSSVRRAIDNIDMAIGVPTTMQGRSLEDIAAGIDCREHAGLEVFWMHAINAERERYGLER